MRESVRRQAATWSESKMSSRKKDKGDENDRPDWVDNLEKHLMEAMENQSDVILKRMADLEGNMNAKVEGIRLEMAKSAEQVKGMGRGPE